MANDFQDFCDAVQTDETLQAKLEECGSADDIVELAKTTGYSIAPEDIQAAADGDPSEELRDIYNAELSEDQLEEVAGGIQFKNFKPRLGLYNNLYKFKNVQAKIESKKLEPTNIPVDLGIGPRAGTIPCLVPVGCDAYTM